MPLQLDVFRAVKTTISNLAPPPQKKPQKNPKKTNW
jgi:hypothetical protein